MPCGDVPEMNTESQERPSVSLYEDFEVKTVVKLIQR